MEFLCFVLSLALSRTLRSQPARGSLVLASPTLSSLDGYDLFIPEWEVQVTPESKPITLNGTIEEVHAELLRLNPNWDEDFPDTEVENALVERDTDFHLEKRTDFTESKYNCFGRWGRVRSTTINSGISYLRKVSGKPGNGAGPGNCGRVSCSYRAAIYWCNDSKKPKQLNSYGSIADGAKYIAAKCVIGPGGINQYTAGQVFHKSDWNVIVREDSC
ncbi:hypothetical protein BDW59DRAFT_171894 [Aspergillus cavernicola]|uniref:Ecp2 effector protein domain-containing protein n=1 Tax=Aspergillus cavernicola TaxID=176166 RepID=A0ABR4IEM6_9EURO